MNLIDYLSEKISENGVIVYTHDVVRILKKLLSWSLIFLKLLFRLRLPITDRLGLIRPLGFNAVKWPTQLRTNPPLTWDAHHYNSCAHV